MSKLLREFKGVPWCVARCDANGRRTGAMEPVTHEVVDTNHGVILTDEFATTANSNYPGNVVRFASDRERDDFLACRDRSMSLYAFNRLLTGEVAGILPLLVEMPSRKGSLYRVGFVRRDNFASRVERMLRHKVGGVGGARQWWSVRLGGAAPTPYGAHDLFGGKLWQFDEEYEIKNVDFPKGLVPFNGFDAIDLDEDGDPYEWNRGTGKLLVELSVNTSAGSGAVVVQRKQKQASKTTEPPQTFVVREREDFGWVFCGPRFQEQGIEYGLRFHECTDQVHELHRCTPPTTRG